MNRAPVQAIIVLVASLALPSAAAAHRLDEYLQAARISIDVDTISLDIDLTPGVTMAAQVFAAIDSNRDGEVSETEAGAYAERVLRSLAISVDDRPAQLTLVAHRFPTFDEMSLGTGTIRLAATAPVPRAVGVHHVSFVNTFLPELSVYLANVLVSSDGRVSIAEQRRDVRQRSLTFDYRVKQEQAGRAGWSLAALAMFGLLVSARLRGNSWRSERTSREIVPTGIV